MIPSLILLVFDDSDLGSLAAAAAFAKSHQVENLWVLHNPQLGISTSAQDIELARRVAELEAAERQAVARRDYASASQYRDQANGLEVERGLAIKNAFKSMPKQELEAAYAKAFAEITPESTGAKNILVEAIPDPLNKNQAFTFLASQASANWIDQFTHGNYIVAWAGALGFAKPALPMPKGAIPRTPEPQPRAPQSKEGSQEAQFVGSSEEDPEKMPFFQLRAYAKEKGVKGAEKMNKGEILNALKLLSL